MRKAYSYIRMSTETQRKGDSLRRQLEASANYAKEHGFELVESIDGKSLRDIGVSGYKGKNSQRGVLAYFLEALKKGKIEENSVLLIESRDRLSRDRLTEALTQFISILDYGIEIVTLLDKQQYTKEIINKNQGALFISLAIMFRANEESEIKSQRLQAVWNNKREKALEKAVTTVGPGWLTFSRKHKRFELVPERAKVVRNIFELCANTCGLYGISKYLNENAIPVFGRGKMWNRSYVHKILDSRAVLGEYQPQKVIDGKRIPVGDPIKDYYPAVITETEFNLAHAAINRRSTNDRGGKGRAFSNIFSGLVYCSRCGGKLALRNRGEPPKGGRYLICQRNFEGNLCDLPEVRLDSFQNTLLKHLKDVDFSSLHDDQKSPLIAINEEITAAEQALIVKENEFRRGTDLILSEDLSTEAKARFVSKLNATESEIQALKAKIEDAKQRRDSLEESERLLDPRALVEVISAINSEQDDFYFRSSVNQVLAKAIERIDFVSDHFVFHPYEYDDNSPEVKAYRATFKKRERMPLDAIIKRKSFADFCKAMSNRIVVLYKNGAVRHVQLGSGKTMVFQKAFDTKPLRSQNIIK